MANRSQLSAIPAKDSNFRLELINDGKFLFPFNYRDRQANGAVQRHAKMDTPFQHEYAIEGQQGRGSRGRTLVSPASSDGQNER